MAPKLSIGALARRTGVSVKALRFYSDQGLLPPAERSPSGYRLYTEAHVLRVDLIRGLRDAGVGLELIAGVLRRDTSLDDVLRLRLQAVEVHIAGLKRVASALRLAIRSGADEDQLRRVTMATRASNEDRRAMITTFYEKVAAGLPIERGWVEGMIDASTPSLPDDPTAAQLDAWLELHALLDDPTLLASRRLNAIDAFAPVADAARFIDAQHTALTAVGEARARGVAPTADEAGAIVERFARDLAGEGDPAATAARLRTKYDPRGARYWELVAIMRGDDPPQRFDDWRWLGEALEHHHPI
jgi:DNA-binding transcriptional MerR regulator